jgi:uncharacterized protein (DUF4415 family)
MSDATSKKSSETDWARVDSMTDETIDTSDVPALPRSFFSRARLRMPRASVPVRVHVDPDTYSWYQALGDECEGRMQAALRIYAESHKVKTTGA